MLVIIDVMLGFGCVELCLGTVMDRYSLGEVELGLSRVGVRWS